MRAKPLVFTNGCFDMLHEGHFQLLRFAAQYGTLIVGIPDDNTVTLLKGPPRPINTAEKREYCLSLLPYVAAVITYRGSPEALLEQLRPDILVRGEDQNMDGARFAKRTIRAKRTPGISTTQMLEEARANRTR
jgi:D-beta-D-heptose 7-phosphate kinase/D-beta-D-heptose 1-phosphate adenosyltransferase